MGREGRRGAVRVRGWVVALLQVLGKEIELYGEGFFQYSSSLGRVGCSVEVVGKKRSNVGTEGRSSGECKIHDGVNGKKWIGTVDLRDCLFGLVPQ